ncbi:hypothetical protein ABPG75_001637 [Micractinium tetrahymenae]
MAEAAPTPSKLHGLTPASLQAGLQRLPRRALQNFAKQHGLKANAKSEVLVASLFERFIDAQADAAAAAPVGGAAGQTAAAAAPAAHKQQQQQRQQQQLQEQQGLSPVSEAGRYSSESPSKGGEAGTAPTCAAPALSPLNLLFFLHVDGRSAGSGAVGASTDRQASLPETARMSGDRSGAGTAAACGGSAAAAAAADRQSSRKRKAEDAAASDGGAAPAAKRQARKSGGSSGGAGGQENAAAAARTKPAAAAAAPRAALQAGNDARPVAAHAGTAAMPSGALPAPSAGSKQVAAPAAAAGKPPPRAPSTGGSLAAVQERARKAEERHMARRAAAAAKAAQRGGG